MIILIIAGLLISGWVIGSLVNYLADVLPTIRRLGQAVCYACQTPYNLKEYILMRPCDACGTRRAARAWVVQILAVVIVLLQWFLPSARLGFWAGTLVMAYFGLVAVIDLEHRLILHVVSAAGAVIGFGVGYWMHGLGPTLLGGLGGVILMALLYLFGWVFAWFFGKMRGRPIEEDAMGFGDIMLGAVLGLLLGWPGITAGVVFTILIAGVGSVLIILAQLVRRSYQPFAAVAFGPYMLLAAILLLYWPS